MINWQRKPIANVCQSRDAHIQLLNRFKQQRQLPIVDLNCILVTIYIVYRHRGSGHIVCARVCALQRM